MTDYQARLTAVLQDLDDEAVLAELVLFPEISCLGDQPARLVSALSADARKIISELPVADLHRRHLVEAPEVRAVEVEIPPPTRSLKWTRPVRLTFQVLVWKHAHDAFVALVPALGIEVVANRPEQLERRIPEHIRFALLRSGDAASPAKLAHYGRFGSVELREVLLDIKLPTPKQAAMEAARGKPDKSVLREVADDMTLAIGGAAYEIDSLVTALAEALSGRRAQSVLLTGPSGVGKTAAVRELVNRRVALGFGATGFWATSGGRLVAGMSGFGMWQERCRLLCREAADQRAVLYLGNLAELMQVGKSTHNPQGIAAFLRPYLARGELTVIAEATPDQLPIIEREDPHLLAAFHPIAVEEPEPTVTCAILRARAGETGAHVRHAPVAMTEEALATLDRLHRRYATYSANPGRPLRFLENLLADRAADAAAARVPDWLRKKFGVEAPQSGPVGPADVTAAFARETGLPLFLLDPDMSLDLAAAHRFFAERVIGQPEAVGLIVDLLATVKAGLTRPRKPIAGLMFIGPTGVGKTEMAKSLAEFLFGDKGRLTRFDMSEYADPAAVARLIGGAFGAEGHLTAKVREQPFSVVLLDEFEKAHPSFLDLLLQVFGEGRLTDAGGRPADFCNSVVILTSNLGAEGFQQGPGGFVRAGSARADARSHFVEEVRAAVRPELFNRIDRVVPFAPLDEATVAAIAKREIELIRARDGLRFRSAELSVPDDVVAHLAIKGYDPRYGARPLKRAVERQLLVPLAGGMVAYSEQTALGISVSKAGAGLEVAIRTRTDAAGRVVGSLDPGDVRGRALECLRIRRKLQRLGSSAASLELANEIYTLERLEKQALVRGKQDASEPARAAKLARLRKVSETMQSLSARALEMEERVLLSLYEGRPVPIDGDRPRPAALDEELDALLLSLLSLRYARPDDIVLALFCDDCGPMFELARAYADVAAATGASVRVTAFTSGRQGRDAGAMVYSIRAAGLTVFLNGKPTEDEDVLSIANRQVRPMQAQLARTDGFLATPRDGVVGLALAISGPAAKPRFENELGLHHFAGGKLQPRCLVNVFDGKPEDYVPPIGIERRGGLQVSGDRRRTYDFETSEISDPVLEDTFAWSSAGLGKAISDRLAREAEKLADE